MDPFLIALLLLLLLATVLAVIQARKVDKCLKDFRGFHVTLAEQDGDLTWGTARVYSTGLEIYYTEPVDAKEGHQEFSFIFYKDQYEAIDALYRYQEGLSEKEQQRRARIIRQTARPGLWRRTLRRMRNWISMVRDALLQAVTMVIGVAKTSKPGTAVLSGQETHLKALSSEIIGHVGNAYDPLLEQHLFKKVVLEVTHGDYKHSYCGWLKDYTSRFVEVVDAVANTNGIALPAAAYGGGDDRLESIDIRVEQRQFRITNGGRRMLYVSRIEAGPWQRPIGCVLPPGYTADLMLPADLGEAAPQAWIGSIERVDMLVPRTHALVRHAAQAVE